MIEPTLAKVFLVLIVLAALGGLVGLGQGLANPEEYFRRMREERERERRWKKMEPLYGCGVWLLVFFLFFGFISLRALYEVYFGPESVPTSTGTTAAASPAPPPVLAPPPKPLVEGRPEHLRGVVADGCTLLTPQEASASVGRPLVYDGFSLWRSRDTSVLCAYVDRPVRHPQRPRQEVLVQLVSSSFLAHLGPASAADPDGLRLWKANGDGGVRVAVPTAHGFQVLVRVTLRHLKASPDKRTKAERAVARQLALLAQERASGIPAAAVEPPPLPTARGTQPDAWVPSSRADLVYQDGPVPERTGFAVLEALYRLRAEFGTRVKVVVLDEVKDEQPLDPEALARVVEGAFEVGRADPGPRKDGALVLIDLATHRAWFFFGPDAPALTVVGKRPFPREWHGRELTLKGPGVATRLKALAAAYTRAYQKPRRTARLATSASP